VSAFNEKAPWKKVDAVLTPSGNHAFPTLPGLEDFIRGNGSAEAWSEAIERSYIVEINDPLQRYLPCRLQVMAPCQGLYQWDMLTTIDSPVSAIHTLPLYPAPTYPALPTEMAVTRASLFDPVNKVAAAWAMIEVSVGTMFAKGFSDGSGNALVVFPLPEPADATEKNLRNQRWECSISAYYSRFEPDSVPELHALNSQGSAYLWRQWPPVDSGSALTNFTARYGETAILKTDGYSYLYITNDGIHP
jgi:hypothetical protein